MSTDVKNDPLDAGFFTPQLASLLLDIPPRKIIGWLRGYSNSNTEPVLRQDFDGYKAISFLDLMELRFIEYFRSHGVSMPTIRASAEKARRDWHVRHPFALSKAKYITDRRKIFAQVAEDSGDEHTWEMASGQHEMWEAIESIIAKGVEFDPSTQIARTWKPRASEFPNVIIDPRIAFGRPILESKSVPTDVLFRQWKAEGRKSVVAGLFDIPEEDVETALNFELSVAA